MDEEDTRVESAVERFQEACRRVGAKVTHQRLVVLRSVVARNDHPDAEAVYESVRKEMPTISLDTVYRTLWFLRDLGILSTVGPQRDRVRFDPDTSTHHHFVCARCGTAHDFRNPEFDELAVPPEIVALGRVETSHVELRGLCTGCLGNEGKQDINGLKGVGP